MTHLNEESTREENTRKQDGGELMSGKDKALLITGGALLGTATEQVSIRAGATPQHAHEIGLGSVVTLMAVGVGSAVRNKGKSSSSAKRLQKPEDTGTNYTKNVGIRFSRLGDGEDSGHER